MVTKKNFTEMSNKKLNALLETANAEDRAAIEAVLKERGQVVVAEIEPEEPMTPEEEAQAQAEREEAKAKAKAGRKAAPKASDEELAAQAEEAKVNVGHKCQFVPFGTAVWVDGVIVGVITEKRSRKVLYAIQGEDGKRVIKVVGSQLLKVLDETVELTVTRRAPRTNSESKREPMTEEQAQTAVAPYRDNIGQTATFTRDDKELTGIIIGIVCDKRTHCVMYRVRIVEGVEADKAITKVVNVVVTRQNLAVSTERSEDGLKLYNSRMNREQVKADKPGIKERYEKCVANLAKAEAILAKAQENLERKREQLAQAKAEYDDFLATQAATTEGVPAEGSEADEPLA